MAAVASHPRPRVVGSCVNEVLEIVECTLDNVDNAVRIAPVACQPDDVDSDCGRR